MYKYINWWSVNRCDKQTWPTWFRQHVGSHRNFKKNVTSIKQTKSHNHHVGDCSGKCEATWEHIEMSINHQNKGLTTSCNYLPECFWCIITLPLHASPNGVWPVQGTISSNENRVVNLPQRDEDSRTLGPICWVKQALLKALFWLLVWCF